jgi:hypothetical protein
VETDEVFCKIHDGMLRLGSRGIINAMGWSDVVWNGISFPFSSNNEREIDVDRFVLLDEDFKLPSRANGSTVDYQRKIIFKRKEEILRTNSKWKCWI